MDIPTERDIKDHERLEAVYEATSKGTQEVTASDLSEPFDERDDRLKWLHEMADRGLVRIDRSLVPRIHLKPDGARLIEASRARRVDRTARRTICQSRLLAWTDQHSEHGDDLRTAVHFAQTNYGWFEGSRFEWHEVVAAAKHLAKAGLIRSSATASHGGVSRLDVAITDEGHECLDRFDGDPGAYVAAQRETVTSVSVSGTGNAVSFALGDQSSATATASTSGDDAVRMLADALAEAMAGLSLDVEEVTENLAALRSDDDAKKRRALGWFSRLATDTSTSATGQVLGAVALRLVGG